MKTLLAAAFFLSLVPALPAGATEDLAITASDGNGITLELRTPRPVIREIKAGGRLYHLPSLPGYAETTETGKPKLPFKGVMIGIPQDCTTEVVVQAGKSIAIGNYRIAPVPRMVVEEEGGKITAKSYLYEEDRDLYLRDIFYPEKIAETDEPGFMRGQKAARLKLYPFSFNPLSGELRHIPKLIVRVNFVPSLPSSGRKKLAATGLPADPPGGPFERLLGSLLINYKEVLGR